MEIRAMKKLISTAILIGLVLITHNDAQEYGDMHPGYDAMTLNPEDYQPRVSGMGLMSGGRLAVLSWGNPGDVYILDNVLGDDPDIINAERFAAGLVQPMGLTVVNDTIYVSEQHQITQLIDEDNNGVADFYKTYNDAFGVSGSFLHYTYGLRYFEGYFWTVLSSDTRWGGGQNQWPDRMHHQRAIALKLGPDNFIEPFTGGYRNACGIGLGYGGILSAENQGVWMPSSKIIFMKQGRFYGYKTGDQFVDVPTDDWHMSFWEDQPNPFESQPVSPPLAWLPHGEVITNPGNPMLVEDGPFKAQLLIGEMRNFWEGKIIRCFVEEIDGELQGCLFEFARNTRGICRLLQGPDGKIFVGILGNTGSWDRIPPMETGLWRIQPNGTTVFEMLAVRSTGPDGMEIEFTKPLAADAGEAAKYRVDTWTFTPVIEYGGGNQVDGHSLNVNSVQVSDDGKTVQLGIDGLQEGYLVKITLENLTSAEGETPWTRHAWYTLNSFGPGNTPVTTEPQHAGNPFADMKTPVVHTLPDAITVSFDFTSSYTLSVMDLKGRVWAAGTGRGPGQFRIDRNHWPAGLYVVSIHAGKKMYNRSFIIN
jgi:hypothetical protein